MYCLASVVLPYWRGPSRAAIRNFPSEDGEFLALPFPFDANSRKTLQNPRVRRKHIGRAICPRDPLFYRIKNIGFPSYCFVWSRLIRRCILIMVLLMIALDLGEGTR